MNGDQLQYEVDNAGVPNPLRSDWPTKSFDARDWAKEFNKAALKLGYPEMDEAWLVGWFANALMSGYDRGKQQ